MFLAYNLLALLLSPIWLTWMLVRSRRRAEAPNWTERTGNYMHVKIPKGKPAIWIHAVSVGEVMAVLPVLRQVRALMPDHHLVLSVTTSSGHHTAREHAVDLYDDLVYFPIDLARFQLSAMTRIRPDVVAIMETELWYNFLWAAKAIGAQTLLINGRISDRSFRRSSKIAFFYRALLGYLDRTLMQTEEDARRISALGAKSPEVFGNCKFDQAVDGLDADPAEWRAELGLPEGLPVVVVGSTRGEDEERFVLDALELMKDQVAIVWAPRHLERADAVAAGMGARLGPTGRRSKGEKGVRLVLDTYGELAKVYSVADVVIIGGGFGDHGGQNLLQPLAHGKPVVHGPHMQNFRDVADAAGQRGATVEAVTALELRAALQDILADSVKARTMGDAGRQFVEDNAGASRRYALAIQEAAANIGNTINAPKQVTKPSTPSTSTTKEKM
jgi:3-deoxy-D-manno-octulosonic-acid transferase